MERQIVFSLMSFLISTTSFAIADFTGHWVGDGKVSSNIGLNSTCSKIEIVITQTATTLVTQKYDATCNLFGSTWGPIEMTIDGTDVYEDGEKAGTISDDTLLTILPSGSVAYAYNLKLIQEADGSVSMKSYYGAQNSIGAMVHEGTLKKVSP